MKVKKEIRNEENYRSVLRAFRRGMYSYQDLKFFWNSGDEEEVFPKEA